MSRRRGFARLSFDGVINKANVKTAVEVFFKKTLLMQQTVFLVFYGVPLELKLWKKTNSVLRTWVEGMLFVV